MFLFFFGYWKFWPPANEIGAPGGRVQAAAEGLLGAGSRADVLAVLERRRAPELP